MDGAGWLVAVGTVAIVALAIWASRHVRHPEQAAGHGELPPDSDSDRFYRETDAPAGPDAEDPVLGDRPLPPPAD